MRRHVVGDRARAPRPGSRGCRGWGRRPSGCAASSRGARPPAAAPARCRSAAGRCASQVALLRRGPADAELALHAPLGEQRQLARQQRLVVGRQRRRPARAAASCTRACSASRIRRVGLRGVGSAASARGTARCPGRSAAGSPASASALQHLRARSGRRRAISRGHVHEGPHVLLRRRRVHHDQRAAGGPAGAGSAESWRRPRPGSSVSGCSPCRGAICSQPALEGHRRPASGQRIVGRAGGRGSARMDN